MTPAKLLPIPVILLALSTANSAELPFSREAIDSKIEIGYGLAVGDVDGDGREDILLADKNEFVWYRNPDFKKFVLTTNKALNGHLGPKMRDNVCIAARDIDGDGKVEIAVGSQWNPGETSEVRFSGSAHVLVRPEDPTERWGAIRLPNEPTTHRMRWVRVGENRFQLLSLPLHGRGNKKGKGDGVRISIHERIDGKWKTSQIETDLHMTHNFDSSDWHQKGPAARLFVASAEGLAVFQEGSLGKWEKIDDDDWRGRHTDAGAGEARIRYVPGGGYWSAVISPMHGNEVRVSVGNYPATIDTGLGQGHALAWGNVAFGEGPELIAGWRNPDAEGKTGIKIYSVAFPGKTAETQGSGDWTPHLLDDQIATEDIAVADIDQDGDLDIIGAGRATKNVVLYRNTTK